MIVALLAALPQLLVYGDHVRKGDFPGSAYQPRVEAFVEVSRTAAEGGPFATVRVREGYSVAPVLLSDLGIAAIMDALGRFRGEPVGVSALGVINLVFLAAAALALVLAFPPRFRVGLAAALLLVPLSVWAYRSPDVVAIHGALAALALATAVAAGRPATPWTGILLGALVFVLHKVRSTYGLYALAGLVAVTAAMALRTRDRRPLLRLLIALLAFGALQVPWQGLTRARASDPRVIGGDTLTSHGVYQPLVSGIGWSENRWGIKPWDPWVATFVARRLGRDIAPIATPEGERQAREVYLSLWREAPSHLLGLYLARIPRAFRQHFFLGLAGACVWLALLVPSFAAGWRMRDAATLASIIAPAVLVFCLVAQIVLIDPRLLYSYPLRFVSAVGLATALTWLTGALAERRGWARRASSRARATEGTAPS